VASLELLSERFAAVAGSANAPRINVIPERRTRYEVVAQVLALAQRSRVSRLGVSPVPD
jgi:hypothetical protein